MDAAIKTDWVSALRSGNFPQCTGVLREERGEADYGYCCLGVLTWLAIKAGVDNTNLPYGTLLAETVSEWACLASLDPVVSLGGRHTLSALNDRGFSFTEIADAIEEGL